MPRYRYQLRFVKQGDLRFISHRDLLRALERLFRRAGLKLSMSEGFHPKPRLSFPLALALGIESQDEVMQLELAEAMTPDSLLAALKSQCPPGLAFTSAEQMPEGAGKPRVQSAVYELPVPADREEVLRGRIGEVLASASLPVHREGRKGPLDLRPVLQSLEILSGRLRMTLLTPPEGSVRPSEVLELLGLADLEQHGCHLTRTAVQLAGHNKQRSRTGTARNEERDVDQRSPAGGVPDRDR